ncbi:MAG: FAD-dependent oxidoreductase [Leptolyngbyaceae bacterium]|nr:FAD-dependent oxidoreductase [Leptolyngbyaceae bacterium]
MTLVRSCIQWLVSSKDNVLEHFSSHLSHVSQPVGQRIRRGGAIIGVVLATGTPLLMPRVPVVAQAENHETDVSNTPAGPQRPIDQVVACELLIVGGGLSGVATAYESLKAGRTVCMTELTDWFGGQISSQGTSALDEARKQRSQLFYSRGYNELRQRIEDHYGQLNPGDCWVSAACFIPSDAHEILSEQLEDAADDGDGELLWFPSTVIKEIERSEDGRLIEGAIAIQHQPAPGTAPLNTEPLSHIIEDAYRYEDSERFTKTIIQFVPLERESEESSTAPTPWYVIEATETGEVIALADVPYRVGIDPRTYLNPSSASESGDPYCTQGFTYTFAMEQTEDPQEQTKPSFYDTYQPYYGYDPNPNLADFNAVFTYRRIWAPDADKRTENVARFGVSIPKPGDISMQNWVWGNDYRPGTVEDNLVYTRNQLEATGQLEPGGWLGGLRTETLRGGEELALGFYYWLVEGTTDSQLGEGVKEPHPNHILLEGFDAPMGTAHGLSKYPYIREGRRIIGRPSYAHEDGFAVNEIDISWQDYRTEFYQQNLSEKTYRQLWQALAGLEATNAIRTGATPDDIMRRTRSTIFPDSVGIAQYAIDFHPCLAESPPEKPGNIERPGARQGHGQAYPGQIPLRAMIPQEIDNLIVASKSIATSHVAAAAYRVHSFEWSVGAAAGTTADFALEKGIMPYEMVDDLPRLEPQLIELRQRLSDNDNPIAFPNTSIFNLDWDDWRVWGG